MWRRSDSRRFLPTHIGKRFRGASFHIPAEDRDVRKGSGVRLDGHGMSQIGRTRRVNQDQFFIQALAACQANCFLGVADGIGGGPGGTAAALDVIDTIQDFVKEKSKLLLHPERSDGEMLETLTRGLKRCRHVLAGNVQHRPEHSGMGTTLTAALVIWPKFYLIHMGDSRAYLLRNGELQRLTRDHTYGQALMDAGFLNWKTLQTSRWKSVVSNFLGEKTPDEGPEVHPDIHIERLRPGDTVFLCTDGVTDLITDKEIDRILSNPGSTEDQCRSLLNLVRDRGARDDATAMIARFMAAEGSPGTRRNSRTSV